jgi:indole-3-glycerol phosphate synthase
LNVLEKIITGKREAVRLKKSNLLIADLRARVSDMLPTRGFEEKLRTDAKPMALIAEVKKASPSKGVIAENFDPVRTAESYQAGGASCISVLTDAEHFMGSPDDLRNVRQSVQLPVLRKDFVVDELCVLESREMGADCLLLIAAALSPLQLQDYVGLSREVGIDPLVEVHDAAEMAAALGSGSSMIGINNRDLQTFETNLAVTETLAPLASGRLVVSESAISTRTEVMRVCEAGASAILVGETLMRERDPAAAIRRLLGR